MFPHMTVTGEACPMWVPLVENNEFDSPGADYSCGSIWNIFWLPIRRSIRSSWAARIIRC